MQQFATDHTLKNRKTLMSKYDSEVQSSKDKVVVLQNINLAEYSTSKEAFQYYYRGIALGIIGLITSGITYPLSVRVVKKVFKLRDFVNINMAVLPIMMNINAFVLGMAQGRINYYLLLKNYQPQHSNLQQMLL